MSATAVTVRGQPLASDPPRPVLPVQGRRPYGASPVDVAGEPANSDPRRVSFVPGVRARVDSRPPVASARERGRSRSRVASALRPAGIGSDLRKFHSDHTGETVLHGTSSPRQPIPRDGGNLRLAGPQGLSFPVEGTVAVGDDVAAAVWDAGDWLTGLPAVVAGSE